MEQVIRILLSNFTLTFLIVGAIAAAISIASRGTGHWREAALAYYCLSAIGLTFLYNFVMHVFFGDVAAAYIGWANSPFQAEVGWASLGFAVIGFFAFHQDFELRLAAIVGPACFLWGAAIGHVYQMVTAHNFAPGNAGVIFWTDILVPLIGLVLLWLRYRGVRAQATA